MGRSTSGSEPDESHVPISDDHWQELEAEEGHLKSTELQNHARFVGQRQQFCDLLASIDRSSGEGHLASFEKVWSESHSHNHCSWQEWRDAYGFTTLMLLILCKHSDMVKAFDEREMFFEHLGLEMMSKAPHLVTGDGCKIPMRALIEPFKGQTALHLAAANSDVPLITRMLELLAESSDKGAAMLNSVATGVFWKEIIRSPSPCPITKDGLSVLDSALIGPVDDEVCMTLVRSLVSHGARPVCFDTSQVPRENGTVLHRLAKCAWGHKKGGVSQQADHMTPERMRILADFFTDGDETQPVDQSIVDMDGYTALEMAALLGNDVVLVQLLQKQAITIWEWGHKSEVRLPLEHIDCGSREDTQVSVLELLSLYKHHKCQTLGIVVDIIERKWDSFGRKCVCAEFLTNCILVVLVTVGSLGETSAPANIRLYCRICTMVITCIALCYVPTMIWLARHTEWVRRMSFWPKCETLDIWQIGPVRNITVMVMVSVVMAVQTVQHRLEFTKFHEEVMDALNAFLVFLMWMTLLRFLALFEQTGVMVDAIPKILIRDMFPWSIVYVILLLASAGAMRIAVKHFNVGGADGVTPVTAAPDDTLGTFSRAMLTLLESTFGPDVHFQDAVLHRPLIVCIFFLGFLWLVSIILLNLLIAMFSDTFEEVRAKSFKEMMHRRAVEVINHEKLMPLWVYQRHHLASGTVFVDEDSSRPSRRRAMSSLAKIQSGTRFEPTKATESTALVPRKKRWLRMYQTVGQPGWCQFRAPSFSES